MQNIHQITDTLIDESRFITRADEDARALLADASDVSEVAILALNNTYVIAVTHYYSDDVACYSVELYADTSFVAYNDDALRVIDSANLRDFLVCASRDDALDTALALMKALSTH